MTEKNKQKYSGILNEIQKQRARPFAQGLFLFLSACVFFCGINSFVSGEKAYADNIGGIDPNTGALPPLDDSPSPQTNSYTPPVSHQPQLPVSPVSAASNGISPYNFPNTDAGYRDYQRTTYAAGMLDYKASGNWSEAYPASFNYAYKPNTPLPTTGSAGTVYAYGINGGSFQLGNFSPGSYETIEVLKGTQTFVNGPSRINLAGGGLQAEIIANNGNILATGKGILKLEVQDLRANPASPLITAVGVKPEFVDSHILRPSALASPGLNTTGIRNEGPEPLKFTGGSVSGFTTGIANTAGATLIVDGASFHNNYTGIYNDGQLIIGNNNRFTANTYGVFNSASGTMSIGGKNIFNHNQIGVHNLGAITNIGDFNQFNHNAQYGLYNNGTIGSIGNNNQFQFNKIHGLFNDINGTIGSIGNRNIFSNNLGGSGLHNLGTITRIGDFNQFNNNAFHGLYNNGTIGSIGDNNQFQFNKIHGLFNDINGTIDSIGNRNIFSNNLGGSGLHNLGTITRIGDFNQFNNNAFHGLYNNGTIGSIGNNNQFNFNKQHGLFNDIDGKIGSIGNNNIFSNNLGSGLHNLGTITSIGNFNQFNNNAFHGLYNNGTIGSIGNNNQFNFNQQHGLFNAINGKIGAIGNSNSFSGNLGSGLHNLGTIDKIADFNKFNNNGLFGLYNNGTIGSIGSSNEFAHNIIHGLGNDRKGTIGAIGNSNIFLKNAASGLHNLGAIESLGKDNQFLQNKIAIFDAGTIKGEINNNIFEGNVINLLQPKTGTVKPGENTILAGQQRNLDFTRVFTDRKPDPLTGSILERQEGGVILTRPGASGETSQNQSLEFRLTNTPTSETEGRVLDGKEGPQDSRERAATESKARSQAYLYDYEHAESQLKARNKERAEEGLLGGILSGAAAEPKQKEAHQKAVKAYEAYVRNADSEELKEQGAELRESRNRTTMPGLFRDPTDLEVDKLAILEAELFGRLYNLDPVTARTLVDTYLAVQRYEASRQSMAERPDSRDVQADYLAYKTSQAEAMHAKADELRKILTDRPNLNPIARSVAEGLVAAIDKDYAYTRDRVGPDGLYNSAQVAAAGVLQATANVAGSLDALGGHLAVYTFQDSIEGGKVRAQELAFEGFDEAWHRRLADFAAGWGEDAKKALAEQAMDSHAERWALVRFTRGGIDTLLLIPVGLNDLSSTPLEVNELGGVAEKMTVGTVRDVVEGLKKDPAYALGGVVPIVLARGKAASWEGLSAKEILGQVSKEMLIGTGKNTLKLVGVGGILYAVDQANQLAGAPEGSTAALAAAPLVLSARTRAALEGKLDGRTILSNEEFALIANDLGCTIKVSGERVNGQAMYRNRKSTMFISKDVGSTIGADNHTHNGGIVKISDSPRGLRTPTARSTYKVNERGELIKIKGNF